ncbi:MAG: methyl-accepting chemotaxis protein [Thermodesulfobacteriota bacterium]
MKTVIATLRQHLWIKVIGAVCTVLILVIGLMIAGNIRSQTEGLQQQTRHQSQRLATAIEGGMFDALAVGDNQTVVRQFQRLNQQTSGIEVYVFDFNGEVAFSTVQDAPGKKINAFLAAPASKKTVAGMIDSGTAPEAPVEGTIDGTAYQSVFRPILNEKRCHHCHGSSRKLLGGMQVRSATQSAVNAAASARNWNIFMGLAGILILSALVFLLFQRMVNHPVRRLLSLAGKMRQGDLSCSVPVIGQDEISHMSARMNLVNENLRTRISDIKSAAQSLSELSSRQAAAVEETSSSTEQMAATTQQNADHASTADQLMQQVQQGVNSADAAMKELSTSMDEIGQSSDRIAKIIKTIDDIAFQTNLLALNAAVEAARAGEAGAGFAVVANEVRNLAMRSAEAAKSTSELVDNTVGKIEHGTSAAAKVNDAFTEMTGRTAQACDLVTQISTASAEQSQGIEQINRALSEVDQGVQQVAANAEQLTETTGTFKVEQDEQQDAPSAARPRTAAAGRAQTPHPAGG